MPGMLKIVLLINPSRAYTRGLLNGIAQYARLRGSWTFYRPLEYREPKFRRALLSILESLRPHGILMREPPQIDEIIKLGVPTVSFPYTREIIPGVANVVVDHRAVGAMAAGHLLDLGLQQFAYCGFDDWWWSRKRKEGFTETIERAGFEVHSYQLPQVKSKRTWSKEVPFIAEWLNELPKPVGLMASNDDRAELVTEACRAAGPSIPDDVAMLGVDNDETICDLCAPPLSSVALNIRKAGYDAAALLDRMVAGKAALPQTIHIKPTRVVTRQSTDILAVDDPEVAAAVRYIRQFAKANLGVDSVVAECNVSRRVLEKRFRHTLGCSIHDKIRQVRVGLATAMLAETQMSVSQIARELDFPDAAHFSRYFRQAKGLSPQQYRKQLAP